MMKVLNLGVLNEFRDLQRQFSFLDSMREGALARRDAIDRERGEVWRSIGRVREILSWYSVPSPDAVRASFQLGPEHMDVSLVDPLDSMPDSASTRQPRLPPRGDKETHAKELLELEERHRELTELLEKGSAELSEINRESAPLGDLLERLTREWGIVGEFAPRGRAR